MPMYNQYNQQILDYEQKKKAAEALRQSGLDDASSGRMIGEIYVPRSPLQQIARVMKTYVGSRDAETAQKNIDAARQEQAKALSDWQAAMPRRQAPDQPGPSAEDYMDWASKGMNISPEHASMAMKYADVNLSREARDRALQEKMLYDRQARQEKMIADQEAKQRQYEFMRESQKMNMENRADMARLSAALRPDPQDKMVSVIGPDGLNPVLVPQSQASGMTPFVSGGANKPGSPAAQIKDAKDALDLLKQAAPLVNKSTNSGIGAGVDYLMSLGGSSTAGADTAARLKAIGGMLVAKMPKMSGPQSDKDVLLYKEMAGRIGDPTIPASQKKAAMETINEIQARYAGIDVTPLDFGDKKQPSGQWSIRPR